MVHFLKKKKKDLFFCVGVFYLNVYALSACRVPTTVVRVG